MEYLYVKVSCETARQLGFANIRKRVADGDYILNQSDVFALEGKTLEEKIEKVGGTILTESAALKATKSKYVEHQIEEKEHE